MAGAMVRLAIYPLNPANKTFRPLFTGLSETDLAKSRWFIVTLVMFKGRIAARLSLPLWLVAGVLAAGCGRVENLNQAPDGFAIIREHVISARRNDPPVRSLLDFTIERVDGNDPMREHVPPLVDMQPGVQLAAGTHNIQARVAPLFLPPNYQPKEVHFSVNVESRKVYLLVDDNDGNPVLVPVHPVIP